MNKSRRIGVIVGAFLIGAWAIGCASGSSPDSLSTGGGVSQSHDVNGAGASIKQPQVAEQPKGALPSGDLSLQPDAAFPRIGPKIIKTADLDVATKRGEFQSGLEHAVQIAGRYQGFVLSTTVGSFGPRSGTVVMRVPGTRFEAALADLKGLGKVTKENVSGQDVSQEFVDFQARLRNAKAQETVLLRLMDHAQSVSATIKVEQHLAAVQLQIEQLKGQLRYLGDQTAMSTITVGLTEAGVVAHHESSIHKAWEQAGAAFLAVVSSVIVGGAFILPIGLIVLMGLFVLRRWRPRMSS
jgi:Domain of unknown function (DUF4349)